MKHILWLLLSIVTLGMPLNSKDRVIIIYESDSDDQAAKARAEVELKVAYGKIQFGLFEFKNALGRHPTEAEGLKILVNNPGNLKGWKGPYMDKRYLKDPWKRNFEYRMIDGRPRIFSRGERGTERIDLDKILDDTKGEAVE